MLATMTNLFDSAYERTTRKPSVSDERITMCDTCWRIILIAQGTRCERCSIEAKTL